MKYICTSCGHKFYRYEDRASYDCKNKKIKCDGTAWWGGSSKHHGGGVMVKRYPDVKAFGVNEKGQQIAVTTKGKVVDPSTTRYDLKRDPHGWKATGKKVSKIDQYGRPNR